MAGEISQGMLFDIGYADKITPCLATPEVPVPNGSRAGKYLPIQAFHTVMFSTISLSPGIWFSSIASRVNLKFIS